MKILHLIFSFDIGGAETMLTDIINQQLKKHEVTLLIINNKYDRVLIHKINNNAKVILLNRHQGSKNPIDIFRLNYHIFKVQPDVVHCHESNIIKYLFFKSYYLSLLTVHDTRLLLDGSSHYDKVVAISRIVQEYLRTNNIFSNIVYNGIETKNISKKSEYNATLNFKIIQVGRLVINKKGQDITIKALNLLKQKYPDNKISLDLIGTGSSLNELREIVSELGMVENVNFLGIKDREYIYSHLKDYDLLVQPSIFEGFGLTVIEGMAAGLPVLVSNVEGPMEVICNGEYGFTFQTNDIEDMANQIEYIMCHPDHTMEMAHNGQLYAIENFDISTTVDNYENLYSSITCRKI